MKKTPPKAKNPSRRARARVVLVPGDVEIFRLLYTYRMLRCDHLILLTGRPEKRLQRRLLKLRKAHYLTRIEPPRQKYIYGLDKAAAVILVQKGIADPELLTHRSRLRELKDSEHEIMVVELHIITELATRGSHLRLVSCS